MTHATLTAGKTPLLAKDVKRNEVVKLKIGISVEKLAKILLITAVLIIIAGFVRHYFINRYDAIVLEKHDKVTLLASHIELNIKNRLTAMQLLAGDPEVVSMNPDAMTDELQRAVKTLGFFNAVVFDNRGNFVTEARPEFHIGKVYDRDSFEVALSGRPSISNRIVYNGLDTAYVSLRVPITDEAGTIKGVLVAGLPITQIADMLNQSAPGSMLSEAEYIFVMDSSMQFIAHPELAEIYLAEKKYSAIHNSFFEQRTGSTIEQSNFDNIEKLYIYTALEQTNWRIVMTTPIHNIYAEVLNRSFTDIAAFVFLLITIGLCYYFMLQAKHHKLEAENLRWERLSCASQMAATVAHEIRNPLTSIKGFIQLIMRKPDRPAPSGYLEIAMSEIERIEKLVTEFQMLSRPIKPAEFTPIDIEQIINDISMLMEGQASDKKVKLTYQSQLKYQFPVVYKVMGDQAQLKQVLINLIRNAIEAVEANGQVNVIAKEKNGTLALEVQDNGAGIPQEVLIKIGTPFYTTKPNGTGLGLSVCYNIIQNHNGKLEVTSKIGEGTIFTVLLPYKTDVQGLKT